MKAVTYDFWNTLMWERPGGMRELRRQAVDRVIEEFGLELEGDEIERELGVISDYQRDYWTRGEMFHPDDGARHFGEALAGGNLDDHQREKFGNALLLLEEDPDLKLAPGIDETLRTLKDRGFRLGIVCDVGVTPSTVLRRCLERNDLLNLFDGCAFSDDVGHYKPSARIFEHVLGELGAEPGDATHVGDLRRTDVAGAREIGMGSVRYNGVAEDPPDGSVEADHVIGKHTEILDLPGFSGGPGTQ